MTPNKNTLVPLEHPRQKKPGRSGRLPRAITDCNQVVDGLQATEDKFKYMFDHSAVGNSVTMPSGEISVNHALCEMLGFSQDELTNCKWQDITHLDDVELTQNEMDALISGKKETARFIKRYINKAGSVVWADVGSALRRDKDGRPLYFISTIMDITARKQAEEALRKSEEMLRSIFASTPDSIMVVDLNGNITLCNQAAANNHGYVSPEQMVGKSYYELVDPADRPRAMESLQQVLKQGMMKDIPFVGLKHNGEKFTGELSVETIKDSSGSLSGFVGIAKDVSARTQAVLALKLSEEKFRLLTENSVTGIYIIQGDKIAYINPSLARMFGFSPEEIVNRPFPTDLIHPDDLQAVLGRIQLRLDGLSEKSSITYKTFKKDGSIIHIEIYGTLIDYQGQPALMVTLIDVTQRNQAEAALRFSEERLREVLDNSLDASYKRDLKTNGYGYFSPVITRLSGYTPDEMKTLSLESVMELIHPEDRPEVNRLIAEALSGPPGAAWQVEYRFKHKQGQYFWFQDCFSIMRDAHGQPLALIGSVSEVTARKQAEAALRQKVDELERFQRLTVGRELRMIEMKNEINTLLVQLGVAPKYPEPAENGEIQHG